MSIFLFWGTKVFNELWVVWVAWTDFKVNKYSVNIHWGLRNSRSLVWNTFLQWVIEMTYCICDLLCLCQHSRGRSRYQLQLVSPGLVLGRRGSGWRAAFRMGNVLQNSKRTRCCWEHLRTEKGKVWKCWAGTSVSLQFVLRLALFHPRTCFCWATGNVLICKERGSQSFALAVNC